MACAHRSSQEESAVKAVVFEQFGGPLQVRDVPDPEPLPDGVVVRVKSTGVCRSDWHGWQGHDPGIRLPHVPGHEFSGEVVAVGREVRTLAIGDRVTVPFVSGCGACAPCRRGDPQVCDHQFQPGFTHWGTFAEYVALQHADLNVVRLPESLSFEAAASLGCRFATAYRGLVQLAALQAEETVVVFGCGGVGLSSILVARALGARSIGVDIDVDKLELARAAGAHLVVDARDADVVQRIVAATNGGADVSVDALGSSLTLGQSLQSLRKRGRHVQLGLVVGEAVTTVPMGQVIANELVLFGGHGIAARSYPDLFALISDRKVPIERILGPRLGLADVPLQLERMTRFGGTGIALVDPARA
jgi:alcohol dehydrogenase